MASQTKYTVPFRRKRTGKTNYKKRLSLLKSGKFRLVVRPSLKNITAQIVSYNPDGDKIVLGVHSQILKKLGWTLSCGNVPAAYLTGYLLGTRAQKEKVTDLILDTGLQPVIKSSRLFSLIKGVIDSGITIPVDESMLPSDDRINGAHIASYLSKETTSSAHQFSTYKKGNVGADGIQQQITNVKKKIDTQK